ncbi:MAG: SO2930 family diheme c-type cytochrome [Pseudomonadota bacterium]
MGATPANLAEWQILFREGDHLVLREDALPYDLQTPLFSDYAHKLRTVWLPAGTAASYQADGSLSFPVGTVLTKTFYYPVENGQLTTQGGDEVGPDNTLDLSRVQLIETRVLVKRADGWEALPYVWNSAQTGARLAIAGDIRQVSLQVAGEREDFNYVVPTKNECASCHAFDHTAAALMPIGPKARHLNKTFDHYADGPAPQLDTWTKRGLVTGLPTAADRPVAAAWPPTPDGPLDFQARSYLDINCGHCHNPVGPADTSGLFLHMAETEPRRLGVCKPPIASGGGSGGRLVSIWPGQPEQSIMHFRLHSRDPAAMMPEIGRSLAHVEGADLIGRWIAAMQGSCGEV